MGKNADVEHVRVRENEVRPLADLPASLARRVSVVDRRLEPFQPEFGEPACLVLRERLGGIEVERARLRIACDRIEDGEVEGQRLPRGRAGGDDDVLAALRGLPGLGLVPVERGDAGGDKRRRDARVEIVGKLLDTRFAGWFAPAVRDLLAFEKVRPAGCGGR